MLSQPAFFPSHLSYIVLKFILWKMLKNFCCEHKRKASGFSEKPSTGVFVIKTWSKLIRTWKSSRCSLIWFHLFRLVEEIFDIWLFPLLISWMATSDAFNSISPRFSDDLMRKGSAHSWWRWNHIAQAITAVDDLIIILRHRSII